MRSVSLDDKYEVTNGRIFANGVQALVRLPLLQKSLDQSRGLNTSGYISGYRGSPLGGFDAALWREQKRLQASDIIFQPGINEDLAATAIWGTQQLDAVPDPTVDGVFAIWYGKGPGVDRSGDAMKHANFAGTHRNGGVLVAYGDDHPGKSSTIAHQSEKALAANLIPSLYPSSVQEYLEYGLYGWALSRYSGLWVGLKCVNETVEQTATIDVYLNGFSPELPDRKEHEVNYRPGYRPAQEDEVVVKRYRLPLVHRFVRANRIDRRVFGPGQGRLGIVCAGKSYQDVVHALRLLGVDAGVADRWGISVYKVGCIWPLEPEGLAEFSSGMEELLFVEEKDPFLESQSAEILYNSARRPRIVGKRDETGNPLLPSDVQLDPLTIARVVLARAQYLGLVLDEVSLEMRDCLDLAAVALDPQVLRTPYFCSGCPHNISTQVPDGSLAMAGIGCHAMAMLTRKDTLPSTHMGGEGINWTGLSHFTGTNHMFQNLGDGTYYHSGLMAIRAAVASGANITFKLLYNDAVAMTGGQPVDGPISVGEITHQVVHEGVACCVVLTDSPSTYAGASGLAPGTKVYHRDELDRVQRELRLVPGCSVLVYEQTCAAEKRRRRKRKLFPDPPKRMFINHRVCEGCGDCSTKSTCVSLQPRPTEFGVKRRIDQSSCNKDYSCVKGFCPSFVTVLGAEPRKIRGANAGDDLGLPPAGLTPLNDSGFALMVAGIGGTGVLTVSAILGMAAHLEGKACSIFDMTGLAQKNGAVFSHLRIAREPDGISAPRLGAGEADLLLAFDLVAGLTGDAGPTLSLGRTQVVGNSRVASTAAFQFNPDHRVDAGLLQRRLAERVGDGRTDFLDATGLAVALCGDSIAANLFMMGFTAQRGLLPVGTAAIEKAVQMNGTAVESNLRAFGLGRLWAHDSGRIEVMLQDVSWEESEEQADIDVIIDHRTRFLADYQDVAYGERYRKLVERVREVEQRIAPGETGLTRMVAVYYAKLLAYKDEYEVARLYSAPQFRDELDATFEPGYKLRLNLAPPLISRKDPVTGHLIKREFGPWVLVVFRLLARMKFLRGTALDIFGYTGERQRERQLIGDYEQLVDTILADLDTGKHALAVELAALPEAIKGFGHIKDSNIEEYERSKKTLLGQFREAPECDPVRFINIA